MLNFAEQKQFKGDSRRLTAACCFMSTKRPKAVLTLFQAADGFRHAHIREFFQQDGRRRRRDARKLRDVAASEYGFKAIRREHLPYMIRRFCRSAGRFQDIAIGERTVNVLLLPSMSCFWIALLIWR